MDFTARSIINGKMLSKHSGQHVSILVNIEDVDHNNRILKGKTTDNLDIRVSLTEPISAPIRSWVEVIGVPAGPDMIRCKEVSHPCYLFRRGASFGCIPKSTPLSYRRLQL